MIKNMIKHLQSILTQNNRLTSDPMFVVYDYERVYVERNIEYDDVRTVYINPNNDYIELTLEEFNELDEQYNRAHDYRSVRLDSAGNEVVEDEPIDPSTGEPFNPFDYEERRYILRRKFSQVFFTEAAAKEYIEYNCHNMSDDIEPIIYVESGYKNPEWQAIRQFLIDKAKLEGYNVPA